MMKVKFNSRDPDSQFFFGRLLTQKQIKSWLSSEATRRRKKAAAAVLEQGLSELSVSLNLPGVMTAIDPAVDLDAGIGCSVGEFDESGNGSTSADMSAEQREGCVIGEGESESGGGDEIDGSGITSSMIEKVPLEHALYVGIMTEWEEEEGYMMWEIKTYDETPILSDEQMLTTLMGRRWVHEAPLLSSTQKKTSDLSSLKGKVAGGGRLGAQGERRFAAATGRAGEMKEIEPGILKIHVVKTTHFCHQNN